MGDLTVSRHASGDTGSATRRQPPATGGEALEDALRRETVAASDEVRRLATQLGVSLQAASNSPESVTPRSTVALGARITLLTTTTEVSRPDPGRAMPDQAAYGGVPYELTAPEPIRCYIKGLYEEAWAVVKGVKPEFGRGYAKEDPCRTARELFNHLMAACGAYSLDVSEGMIALRKAIVTKWPFTPRGDEPLTKFSELERFSPEGWMVRANRLGRHRRLLEICLRSFARRVEAGISSRDQIMRCTIGAAEVGGSESSSSLLWIRQQLLTTVKEQGFWASFFKPRAHYPIDFKNPVLRFTISKLDRAGYTITVETISNQLTIVATKKHKRS